MKKQLQRLLGLQSIDLEADEIRSSKGEIDKSLEEFKRVLNQLRDDLEVQRQQLDATVQLQKEKAAEHAEVEERHKKSKSRLSKVSNTKEYAAIEMEIENAKRQSAQLEEELVQLMEAIDATREASAEMESKIEALTAKIAEEETKAQDKVKGYEGRLTEIDERRRALADDISKELARRYAFIRSRRDGVAVVSAAGGCCQGCFMQLPPQLYIELQTAHSLKSCPSCQRILYVEMEEAEAAD